MSFIGVIASKKCFENIKRKVEEKINKENINFVQINLRSIENVKNIKFETIIVEDSLEKFKNYRPILEKIFENIQYLMINTDKNTEPKEFKNIPYLVTYGLNQKATVTVSSISEIDILVYWQKSFQNKEKKNIEIEERRIKKEEIQALKTYEILIIFTLFKIYVKP